MTFKHVKSYHKNHPNPQDYRKNDVCLNGVWDFVFDENDEGMIKHFETNFPKNPLKIIVPYPYQAEKSGINMPQKQCDVIWYKRNIVIEDLNQVYELLFYGVDYLTYLYINGIYVGRHKGGYDSFSFDITDYLKKGNNEIVLRIEDKMHDDQIRGKQRWRKDNYTCFYVETSGIVQSVLLRKYNRQHIGKFRFFADSISKTLEVHIDIKSFKELDLKIVIDGILNVTKKVKPGHNILKFSFEDISQWSYDTPYLYDVYLGLLESEVVDEVYSYLGFMNITAKEKRFYINGVDTYLKMVLNQGYWTNSLTSEDEEDMIKDLLLIKEAGFNGFRQHEKVEAPLFYYYTDLIGLYMWQEVPSCATYSYETNKSYMQEMPNQILDHISHPCIIGYILFNESWGIIEVKDSIEQQKLTVDAYEIAKKLCPYRLAISNDGWEHTISDVITFHNYESSKDVLESTLGTNLVKMINGENTEVFWKHNFFVNNYSYNNQPLIFSEFAGIPFCLKENGWGYGDLVNDSNEFLRRYQGQLDFIYNHKEIRGFCMTQLTDVQQEQNGILTEDRIKKIDFKILKEMHEKFI